MQPVQSAPPSAEGDTEATAKLPVLDVAAYEASLNDPLTNTDTWNLPRAAVSIPTLPPADEVDEMDLSGTHELPMPPAPVKPAAPARPVTIGRSSEVPAVNKAAAPDAAAAKPGTPAVGAAEPAATTPAPARTSTTGTHIALPPSPPLIEELRNALKAAERRIEELNERARIADVERSVAIARANAETAQLRAQWNEHLESLHSVKGRLGVQRADESGLQDELFRRGDRIAQQDRDLAARNAEIAKLRATLDASEQRVAELETDLANLRATLVHRDQRLAILEADLQARQGREAALKAQLADVQGMVDPKAPDLRIQLGMLDMRVRDLETQLAAERAVIAEKNADLEAAEETIRNLELEVRDKTGKLEEASMTVEEWRAVIAESQRSILQRDSRIQQLEADLEKTASHLEQTGEEIALEGPARVLIRTDGNTEFVHVLGRRTRIGRGSDNELVLDSKHVSRYHAVLLAAPAHTTVEDLNSTNGVFVNGKRVARQVLKDGDRLTIGRSQFRYTVRPA